MNKIIYLLFLIGFLFIGGCSNIGGVGVTVVDPSSTFNINCTNCGGGSGGIYNITLGYNTTGTLKNITKSYGNSTFLKYTFYYDVDGNLISIKQS